MGTPAGGRRRPDRPGWRDGLFVALACAGFVAAVHGSGPPDDLARRLVDGSVSGLLTPAALVDLSLPLLLGLAALAGPLIIRARWQSSVLGLGLGWIGLVGVALLQERTFAHSFDVVPGAIGLAALVATGLLLKPGGAPLAAPAGDPEAVAPA